jgi:hypothetical protein
MKRFSILLLVFLICAANMAISAPVAERTLARESGGASPQAAGSIVFSEVLYDSRTYGDTDGEWIELYNPNPYSINLSNWTISDNNETTTFPADCIIGPNCYFVWANNQQEFLKNHGTYPDKTGLSLKLSNTGDYLELRDNNWTLVDQVAWESDASSVWGWGSASRPYANEGKSIVRSDLNQDTDTYADWLNNQPSTPTPGDCLSGVDEPPFGSFDSPLPGSTLSGSIPVTGWALDDSGVTSVKIYREDGAKLVYLGDAVFVEGARPDIEISYPYYPNNSSAGWGYMMLTHFLPGGGNGTYTLHALLTDQNGNEVSLGSKTVTIDNAHAVKPFGAIDTPLQGGAASGSSFINWGWVLTPRPNSIPADGSTISVWVNGVNIGHPTYNVYRSDIASLFPAYANSSGAIGYFYLDTTTYENGVHTIQWTASDSGGNTDGIGSRYFSIQNPGARVQAENKIPVTRKYRDFISIRTGFNGVEKILPNGVNGDYAIQVHELERVEIKIDYSGGEAYQVVGGERRPLPIGSHFDVENGILTWMPGPGFLGKYEFIFPGSGIDRITIEIKPGL